MSKFVPINENDFSLFGAELSGHEFEYFCKHMGAFRRMFEEEVRLICCFFVLPLISYGNSV